MLQRILCRIPAIVLGLCALGAVNAAEYPVALVSDPPPALDGTAERLTKLPTFKPLDNPDHIIFGRQNHTGSSDLSADLVAGYDKHYLYVGAKVRDDAHRQSYFGRDLWRGDHLMLVVDYPRQTGPNTDLAKVFRIGLSPGDFEKSNPEAHIWSPAGADASAIKVAAVKTPDGYNLEAAIPWETLKIKPEAGTEFGFDLLLGDSDGNDQDTLLSLGGDRSSQRPHDPVRLLTAVLADANGRIDPALRQNAEVFPIAASQSVPHAGSIVIPIDDATAAKLKELIVEARIDSKKTGGATYVMKLLLNGKPLTLDEVRNRDRKLYFRHYILSPANLAHVWYVPYSPNFDMAKNEAFRSGGVTINPYELRFDVTKLLRPSGNQLEVVHAMKLPTQSPIFVQVSGSGALSPKLEESITLKDAPTGELPVIAVTPSPEKPGFNAVLDASGAVKVEQDQRTYTVVSAYSTLTPGWAELSSATAAPGEWTQRRTEGNRFQGETKNFTLARELTVHPDHVQVVDRVTNRSAELLPVMYRHEFAAPETVAGFRAAGYEVAAPVYVTQSGEHPVAAFLFAQSGAGLVAEDDLSRAQGQIFRRNNLAGIENNYLAVAPGKTVELEYSFYPLEKADYFLLLNRIRRNWGVNFTIPAGGAFVPARVLGNLSDAEIKAFLTNKSVGYAMDNVPVINTIVTHGSRFLEVDMEPSRKFRERLAKLAPEVRSSIYFHSFIANGSKDAEEFQSEVMQTATGATCDYAGGKYPIFLPVTGNAFARRQEELLDARYALGIEGIFWDEIAYSMYKYDFNPAHWDGVSAQINPKTHQIMRKVTNVTLATLDWRKAMVEKILSRGYLIGNGAPQTRTFTRLHFPRFVETGSITNLVQSQLYTPIALGDHLSERNEFDAYRSMVKGLDYGAVYYWYNSRITATHPTLTAYMYPITPLELGPGYIIGQERILTNRSGLFTWGDTGEFTAHVFNREGIEEKFDIPKVVRNGKTCAEVRIPEGYSAAIIRQ